MDDAPPVRASLSSRRQQVIALILISLAARVAWFALRPTDAVCRDFDRWQAALATLSAGQNPYVHNDVLNWPPMWMITLYALGRICHFTGLSLQGLLFPCLFIADQVLLLAMVGLLRQLSPGRPFFRVLCLGLALNPALVLLSAQHGNFDVLIAICSTVACLWICRFDTSGDPIDWLWACAFVGFGIFCKTPAMLIAPILMIGVRRLSPATLGLGALLLCGPAAVGVATIYVLAPARVWQYVIIYRSVPGFYGINGLLMISGPRFAAWYGRIFPFALLLTLAAICRLVARLRAPAPAELVLLAGLLTLLVPAVGSGFGPQYFYWSAPLLIVSYVSVADRRWRNGLMALGIIVAITYVIQYLTAPDLGAAALAGREVSPAPQRFFDALSSPAGLTLVRLPMFIATLAVGGYGIWLLKTRRFAAA